MASRPTKPTKKAAKPDAKKAGAKKAGAKKAGAKTAAKPDAKKAGAKKAAEPGPKKSSAASARPAAKPARDAAAKPARDIAPRAGEKPGAEPTVAPASVDALRDRTERAIRALRRDELLVRRLRTLDEVILACRAAGRADVATRLADAVAPHSVLGRIVAAATATRADAEALFGELPDAACDQRCSDTDRGAIFARLLRAAPYLGADDARTLLDRADSFVESALSGAFGVGSLDATLGSLAALGGRGREIARRALRRWLERGTISHSGRVKTAIHSSSADASRLGPELIAAFLSDAELVGPIVEQNRYELAQPQVLDAMAALDDDALVRVKAAGFVSEEVVRRLLQAGREEIARRLLASSSPYLSDLVLLGDHDEARRLLADQPPSTTARDAIVRAELGVERIADAVARLASDTTSSTAPVGELVQLGQWLVSRRPNDADLDGLVSLAQTLAERPPILPYDEQNAALRRGDVHLLRTAVRRARGQLDEARASLEAHLAALPALQASVRAPGDRRQETYLKDELVAALIGAAANAGAPDLALRATSALGKASREGRAVSIARQLAAHPGAALAALDALATRPDEALLDTADESLLPTLWRVVLSAPG